MKVKKKLRGVCVLKEKRFLRGFLCLVVPGRSGNLAAARIVHAELLNGDAQRKELRRFVYGIGVLQLVSTEGSGRLVGERSAARDTRIALFLPFFFVGFLLWFSIVAQKIGRIDFPI